MLVEASLAVVPGHVRARVEAPADRATVQVVDVEDFATRVDDAELGRIALVAARNDGGRIAERVRAIRLRLLVGDQVEAVPVRLGRAASSAVARAAAPGWLARARPYTGPLLADP